MAKIHAPNKVYTGTSAGVSFSAGIGETQDRKLIDWFRTHGYTVQEPKPVPSPEDAPENIPEDTAERKAKDKK